MKRLNYLFLLILLIPIKAFAYDITCPAGPFNYSDEFECVITGQSGVKYDEFSGSIQLEDSSFLTCEILQPTNGFDFVTGDNDAAFSYKGTPKVDELVKIKCQVSGKPSGNKKEQIIIPDLKYHIYDSNSDVSNEILRSSYISFNNYVEPKDPTIVEKPRDTSNSNTRLKLISDPNLNFTFSSFKTTYDIIVLFDVNQLNLNIVPNNPEATYEIVGSQTLEIGDNTIDIFVTAPDGVSKLCYTLNIKRLKRGEDIYYPEKDSSLKSLSIEGFTINFESVILDYKIRLKHDVDSIKVNAEPTNEKAKVTISNTEGLKSGNIVEIVVTSEDGSSKTTYMINISKDAPPKDYRTTIYIGAFVLAITIVIIIILKTNRTNKKNPLLHKKEEKKEEVANNVTTTEEVKEEPVQEVVSAPTNVVDLNNTVAPQEATTPQVDENFNVATSNVNTLDLSNAVLPSELQPTVIPNGEPINQENNQQ